MYLNEVNKVSIIVMIHTCNGRGTCNNDGTCNVKQDVQQVQRVKHFAMLNVHKIL